MKTLFAFDDQSIPFRSNVDLTLIQGVKYGGNPILRRGKPGDPDALWARLWAGSVIRDPLSGKFRMWYSGVGSVREWFALKFPMLYAESEDGIHWTKPNLSLKDYNGSKQNNLVDIEYPVEMPAVMYDDSPGVPDDERYKMFSEVHRAQTPKPFLATSPDGLRWKVISHPRHRGVSLYRFNEQYHSAFVMYTPELPGGFPCGRCMGVVRSRDFRNWEGEPCLGFHRANYFEYPPAISEQVHTPAGFWNRGNIMLGVYGQIHQVDAKPGTKFARAGSGMENTREDLGLFISNDGLHYREPIPGFKFVARGQEGTWDGGSIMPCHSFVNVGEHTYYYYGAWDSGMCMDNAAGDIGLAFWPRDRFGYVRMRDNARPAVVQTGILEDAGTDRYLHANVEIETFGAGTELRFELIDPSGRPVPGYTAEDCLPVRENGLFQPLRWKHHHCIDRNIADPVELRLIFTSSGEMWPYQNICTSPLLYCIYIGGKDEMP